MKPSLPPSHPLHPFLCSSDAPQLVTTDGPLLLPFVRRNLRLKFLQFDADGTCTERVMTRQDILAEVRKNWDPVADPRQRIPRRIPSGRTRLDEHSDDRTLNRRHPRGRNAGRGDRVRSDVWWNLPPRGQGGQARPVANRLTVRDMRQIDPAFTAKPAIWVREDAMVVSLESVRAIILHNKMFVFDPDNDKVRMPIQYIQKRLLNNVEDVFLPFEFRALEGILIYTCTVLESEFTVIEPHLRETLGDLPKHITNEQLERLRHLEQKLNHYYSRSRKVQAALQSVLDEDEDMADMYLTEKRRNPGVTRNPMDHDEAEMLLETYLQNVDDLTSKAGLLNTAIDDTENLIEIHLDTMQNRLLLVDLIITVIMTLLSFGTMVTGIFGMNMPLPDGISQLPTSQYYFYGCVILMVLVMTVGFVVLTRWCKRQGIYHGRMHGSARKRKKPDPAVRASEEARVKAETLLSSKPWRTGSFLRINGDLGELPR